MNLKELATHLEASESDVNKLLIEYDLTPEELDQSQIDTLKSKLSKSPTLNPKPEIKLANTNGGITTSTNNGGLSVKHPIKLKAKSVIDNAQNTLQDLTVGIERIETKIADTIYDRLTEVPNNVNYKVNQRLEESPINFQGLSEASELFSSASFTM